MDNLPANRGFKSHVGYLCGQEQYYNGLNLNPSHDCPGLNATCVHDLWQDQAPGVAAAASINYSTDYYTLTALGIIKAHAKGTPLWLHLPYQNVHEPYQESAPWDQVPQGKFWDKTLGDMVAAVDAGIGTLLTDLRCEFL